MTRSYIAFNDASIQTEPDRNIQPEPERNIDAQPLQVPPAQLPELPQVRPPQLPSPIIIIPKAAAKKPETAPQRTLRDRGTLKPAVRFEDEFAGF